MCEWWNFLGNQTEEKRGGGGSLYLVSHSELEEWKGFSFKRKRKLGSKKQKREKRGKNEFQCYLELFFLSLSLFLSNFYSDLVCGGIQRQRWETIKPRSSKSRSRSRPKIELLLLFLPLHLLDCSTNNKITKKQHKKLALTTYY